MKLKILILFSAFCAISFSQCKPGPDPFTGLFVACASVSGATGPTGPTGPSGPTGPQGYGALSTYTAAKCQSGVAGGGFNTPAVNYPTPTCIASGSNYTATLNFIGTGGSSEIIYDSFILPTGWSGAIALDYEFRSADTTAATATLTSVCVGAADIANPTFGSSNATTLTPGGSTNRTVTTVASLTLGTCAAGNRWYFKLVIDTAAKVNAIELIGLRFY